MQIAIIGAGFSGLAAAWHLKRQIPTALITLYDPAGIGGGASGIAAGLMHPYTGLHAKLNWKGREGMIATNKLLKVSSVALGMEVACFKGMLRLALSPSQEADYKKTAANYSDVKWLEATDCQMLISGIPFKPGLHVPEAVSVHCERYLKGLWLACQKLGVHFENQAVENLEALDRFDVIVMATGASKKLFPLPVKGVKGQILKYRWPEQVERLPLSLNSTAYIVMDPDKEFCYAGSTFEKEFASELPDLNTAVAEIQPKVSALYPALKPEMIVDCRAGLRATTSNHLPLLFKINAKTWAITGMGSKGLLYHALLAEELALKIAESLAT